jgi:HPt (histidine-containing phosphotransfer) domain-containing protein
MADSPELTSTVQANTEELNLAIAELEEYRERLVNDTLSMAQKAKIMKAQALASLQPQLTQIDATLESLRQQQSVLSAGN